MVYTLINNEELVEEMGNTLVGGASCRLPAQQGHAITDNFLLVANPGYVVYNIYATGFCRLLDQTISC